MQPPAECVGAGRPRPWAPVRHGPPTLAVRRHEMASFFTSSVVGSRCTRYLARGCQRSYCACRFLPGSSSARGGAWVCQSARCARSAWGEHSGGGACSKGAQRQPRLRVPIVSSALGACMDSGSTQHSRRAQGEILTTSGGSTPARGGGRGGAAHGGNTPAALRAHPAARPQPHSTPTPRRRLPGQRTPPQRARIRGHHSACGGCASTHQC